MSDYQSEFETQSNQNSNRLHTPNTTDSEGSNTYNSSVDSPQSVDSFQSDYQNSVIDVTAKTDQPSTNSHLVNSSPATDFSSPSNSVSLDDSAQSTLSEKLNMSETSSQTESLKETKSKFAKTRPGRWLIAHHRAVRVFLLILGVVAIVGFFGVTAWAINIWNNESSVDDLGKIPAQSSVVYAADSQTELFRFYGEENRQIVSLDQISPNMQQAIIALEDENFWYNETGIPWTNIAGAAVKCAISTGDNCRGGSGLSQQLIKNVKKDNEGSIRRKVRELFTAIKLNSSKSKEQILTDYLNWVPFGRNAYGIEQASQTYFSKSARDLDVVESCYLASMVQRPSYFNSGLKNPDSPAFRALEARKNACLDKIFRKNLDPRNPTKLIATEADLEQLENKQINLKPIVKNVKYPHFRDYLSQELNKFLDEQEVLTGGYKIISTLDPATQDAAEKAVAEAKDRDIKPNGANNAGVIVLDGPTGGIVAMIGSLDYNDESIDGQYNVTLAPRQPGSSIKPYVYAAAFENGLNPGSVLLDAQTTFEPGFTPKNYSGRFSGPISIRSALAQSLNIPAVKAAYLAADSSTPDATKGMDAVFSVTDKMGVKFPCIPTTDGAKCNDPSTAEKAYRSRCGVASALGGCEITMLSHATGINTFAQSGKLRTATPFKQILSPDGRDIYSEKQKSEQIYKQNDKAIDPAIANQINSILSDYNARRPAFGNLSRRLELNGWSGANAVAAKTGTTNDIKDTWTVGYSPYYTVVVWVGNTDSKPLNPRANSVGTTSGIWNDIMVSLHANKEKKGFSKDGLIAIRIDPATGLPVDEGGSVEWMTKAQSDRLAKAKDNFNQNDYQPTEKTFLQNGTVVVPRKLKINRVDGKLAVEGKTLPENIEEKEFRELVAEYPKWQDTADRLMENSQAYQKAPREVSDQDQVADRAKVPTFTSNLDTNTKDVSSISVTAQVQGDQTKTIKSIEILINGTRVVNSTGQSSVNYDKVDSYTGINNTVLIRVTDSLGAISEKTYQNVSFQTKVSSATPLTNSDLASLNVVCEKSATNATDCTFTLPSGKTLPTTFRLRIGTTGNGSSCTENDENVTCSNVSIPGSGSYPIQAKITGNFVNTRSMYNSSSGN